MTPNTTSFEFGDIILVPFPFTDLQTTKKRPAVIISSTTYHLAYPDLIIMAITSQVKQRDALKTCQSNPGKMRGCLSRRSSSH